MKLKKKILALASLACALTMVMAVGCGDGGDDPADDNNNQDTTQTTPGNEDNTPDDGDDEEDNTPTPPAQTTVANITFGELANATSGTYNSEKEYTSFASEVALTIPSGATYITGLKINAEASHTLNYTDATATVDGEELHALNTGGASNAKYRYVEVTLAEGTYKIEVYAKTTNDSDVRHLGYYVGTSNTATMVVNSTQLPFKSGTPAKVNLGEDFTEGTYRLGADANVDIYKIIITKLA